MLIEIKIPVFAESVTEGTIAALHKKVGDAVARDENLADIETDKIMLELPAPQAGVLVELTVAVGDTVTSQQVIGKIDTAASAAEAAPAAAAAAPAAAAPAAAAIVKYTWGKLYNSKAYSACSNLPRFGHAELLNEQQIRDVMALLLDPKSPVNQ